MLYKESALILCNDMCLLAHAIIIALLICRRYMLLQMFKFVPHLLNSQRNQTVHSSSGKGIWIDCCTYLPVQCKKRDPIFRVVTNQLLVLEISVTNHLGRLDQIQHPNRSLSAFFQSAMAYFNCLLDGRMKKTSSGCFWKPPQN